MHGFPVGEGLRHDVHHRRVHLPRARGVVHPDLALLGLTQDPVPALLDAVIHGEEKGRDLGGTALVGDGGVVGGDVKEQDRLPAECAESRPAR